MSPRPTPIIIPGSAGMGGSMTATQSWQGDPLEAIAKALSIYHAVVDPQRNVEAAKAAGEMLGMNKQQGQTLAGEAGGYTVKEQPAFDVNALAQAPLGQQMIMERFKTMFGPPTLEKMLATQVQGGQISLPQAYEMKSPLGFGQGLVRMFQGGNVQGARELANLKPGTEKSLNFDTYTDDKGIEWRIGYDPLTGEEISRTEQGKGKVTTSLTPAQAAIVASRLRGELAKNPYVKDFQDVNNKYGVMLKALDASTKTKNFVAVDQALITLFNKMTDPQSVVRESEYARTPENLSLINRIKGKVEKIQKGGAGLTAEERSALTDMASQFFGVYKENSDQAISEYGGLATLEGIDPERVIKTFRYPTHKNAVSLPAENAGAVDLNKFWRKP